MTRGRLTDRRARRFALNGTAAWALIGAPAAILPALPALAQPAAAPAQPTPADAAAQRLLGSAKQQYDYRLFKGAAASFADFLQQFPTHPEAANARFALGVCHYRLNEHDKAIEQLTKVAADPKFTQADEALVIVGHCNLATQKYPAAVAAFDELSKRFPQSKQAENASLSRTQALYLANQYADASTSAQSFIKTFPQSADKNTAVFFLGLSQKALDQNADASATLAGLLKSDPKTRFLLDATLVLGQALDAQGKLDEAEARFKELVAAAPASRLAEANYNLGAVLYKEAKYDEAAKAFVIAIDKGAEGPYVKPAKLQLGLSVLAAGKPAEARKTLTAVVSTDPSNAAAAKYGLAQCDIADKKWDSAFATLEELSKVQPPPVNGQQIAFDRAVCLSELGKFEESSAAFGAFALANPKSPLVTEAIYRQAFSVHKLAKYDQSHELCGKVIAAGAAAGDFAGPAAELDAENLFLLAKYPEASKAYAALVAGAKEDDRKTRFTFRLGQCAYSQGDFVKTVELLQPIAQQPKVAADEQLGRAVFLLGDALLQQGKFAEAADALQKYLANLKQSASKVDPAALALDRQEAQYKLAYAQLRGSPAGALASPATRQLLTTVAGGVETSPWTTRAHFELGQLAYQAKPPKLDEASAEFGKVLSANGGKPPEELAAPSVYFLGWIDFDQKKYDSAADKWTDVTKRFPKSTVAADAAFHRGVALREAGQHTPALEALKSYESAYPKSQHLARARQIQAACLTSLEKPAEAKTILVSLAGEKTSTNETVLYDLAWSQKQTKDDAGAAGSYRRLIKEFPEVRLATAGRAELAELLIKESKFAEAVDLLEPVVAAKDVEPKVKSLAMALLGVAYKGAGKPDKAADAFAAYAKAFPDEKFSGDALLQAGEQAANLGRFVDAQTAFADLLKRFPQHPQASLAQLKLAEAFADGGKFAEAQAAHQSFLAKYPKDPLVFRAQFGLGWAMQNLKQFEPARLAYKKAIEATNGETAARSQFQIGETFCEEGKFDQAIPALLAVDGVYAYPKWSARALIEAARAFEQTKQPEQAKQAYETVVTKYKSQTDECKVAEAKLKELK